MSASKTPNLQLHSWEASDNIKRVEFNENFTKVDEEIKKLKDEIVALKAQLGLV